MLTEEQFERLIDKVSLNAEDRKTLIRIETIVMLNHESSEKYRIDAESKLNETKGSVKKAHSRIDEEIKFRYLLTGVGLSITGIVGVIWIAFQFIRSVHVVAS